MENKTKITDEAAISSNGVLCEDWVESTIKRGGLKYKHTGKCQSKALYKVKFKSGLRGQIIEQCLCKRHLTALKQRCEGAMKRTGWQSNLEYSEL